MHHLGPGFGQVAGHTRPELIHEDYPYRQKHDAANASERRLGANLRLPPNYFKIPLSKQRKGSIIKDMFYYLVFVGAAINFIGKGDITTQLTIPKEKNIRAVLLAKEDFADAL